MARKRNIYGPESALNGARVRSNVEHSQGVGEVPVHGSVDHFESTLMRNKS